MAKSTKGKSISKHLQTDKQAEYFALLKLAGDNPSVIQNRKEFRDGWTKLINSITTVDEASKKTAIAILNNPDKVVLTSVTSYYLGVSSQGVTYTNSGRYTR